MMSVKKISPRLAKPLLPHVVGLMICLASGEIQPGFSLGQESEPPTVVQSTRDLGPQTRDEVFASERWREFQARTAQWLSVQTAYDEEQIAAIKADFDERIAGMKPMELLELLDEMEPKIELLISPQMSEARSLVTQYFTPAYRRKLAEDLGIEDPLSSTPEEIASALARFQQDRAGASQERANFNQLRDETTRRQQTAQRTQIQAAEQARSRTAQIPGAGRPVPRSPMAPQQRVQRYEAPYGRPAYSVGPWGGIWRTIP